MFSTHFENGVEVNDPYAQEDESPPGIYVVLVLSIKFPAYCDDVLLPCSNVASPLCDV